MHFVYYSGSTHWENIASRKKENLPHWKIMMASSNIACPHFSMFCMGVYVHASIIIQHNSIWIICLHTSLPLSPAILVWMYASTCIFHIFSVICHFFLSGLIVFPIIFFPRSHFLLLQSTWCIPLYCHFLLCNIFLSLFCLLLILFCIFCHEKECDLLWKEP